MLTCSLESADREGRQTGTLQLNCRDASGTLLRQGIPLLRWSPLTLIDSTLPREGWAIERISMDFAEPELRAEKDSRWILAMGPDGLECEITQEAAGRYGEQVFTVALTNRSDKELQGILLPPFTDWIGRNGADARSFCMAHDHLYRGSEEALYAWPPREFAKDVFAAEPARDEETTGFLTSVLVHRSEVGPGLLARGGLRLVASTTVEMTLHIDLVEGSRSAALQEIWRTRGGYRVFPETYDYSRYQDQQTSWVGDIVVTWLNWAWDRDVMDPHTGDYRLLDSLKAARRRFGGYDVFQIWPFWPRAGFDDRYQFDHFRDMPGGIEGLRRQVKGAQELGTRIVASYCVWSESDRDSSPVALSRSFRELVSLALDLEADGVLMDIMSSAPKELLEMASARGRFLTPFNEGDPGWEESQQNLVGRIHNNVAMPRFNLKRYLIPHHPILRVCEPGNEGKVMSNDIGMSFFQGHGVEINSMFPQNNPATEPDWSLLGIAAGILRSSRACFRSTEWEPFSESSTPAVWVNRWPASGKTLYTLCCTDPSGYRGDVLRLDHEPGRSCIDLFRYRTLDCRTEGTQDVLSYTLPAFTPGVGMPRGSGDYSFGCIGIFARRLTLNLELETLSVEVKGAKTGERLEVWVDRVTPSGSCIRRSLKADSGTSTVVVNLYEELGRQTNRAIIVRLLDSGDQLLDVQIVPESLVRLFRVDPPQRTVGGKKRAGMVRVPSGSFRFLLRQSQPVWQATYANQWNVYKPAPEWEKDVQLPGFWIDRYPVTNEQYAAFVEESGYHPRSPEGFLRHFVDGRPPAGTEQHPVTNVSYEDAVAYAQWAGCRLPTEEEWYYAAGGGIERTWPWGDQEPGEELCNLESGGPMPVQAHPKGASPFGVEDVVGNVWQWTASLMDNGRHRVVFLRGGCWHRTPEGIWWVRGGPRPITDHFPLPLFGPAMNRLSTVGFRCVRDTEE